MSTTTEVDNWVAIQDLLFKKPNTTLQVVEHACGHLGWGNSMRGFFNTVALALVLGRRLIITFPIYHRMFTVPYKVCR